MHEHVLLCNESRFTTSVSLMTSVLLFSFNDYSLLISPIPHNRALLISQHENMFLAKSFHLTKIQLKNLEKNHLSKW